jgi:hypothetical protein
MCTVIIGLGVVEPGSVVLGANRDEDPARPATGPIRLLDAPPVAGGRDLRSGGTWLAIRERRSATALLNRRDRRALSREARATLRSRGLLALEVAASDAPRAFVEHATAAAPYGACTVLWASPGGCWVWRWDPPDPPAAFPIGPGWHVITHADLDDRGEPRTAWLLDDLAGWAPSTPAEAAAGLFARLRLHGDGNLRPAVCIHDRTVQTVSSSVVWLSARDARYLHVQGRPCEAGPEDFTHLLAGDGPAPEVR